MTKSSLAQRTQCVTASLWHGGFHGARRVNTINKSATHGIHCTADVCCMRR